MDRMISDMIECDENDGFDELYDHHMGHMKYASEILATEPADNTREENKLEKLRDS